MENRAHEIAMEALITGCADIAASAGSSLGEFWNFSEPRSQISESRRLVLGGQLSTATTKPSQLLSPFFGLRDHSSKFVWPLQKLDPSKKGSIFPTELIDTNAAFAILGLWKAIEQDWRTFMETDPDPSAKIERLLALLQEYAWCIPSNVEEISVYDLARLSAGIAVCLPEKGDAGDVAILVGGDISGLQKFLYTLASGGAAKSLRARSVYLQWLSETMVFFLLSKLGLPPTQIVYAGGGSFQFLVPASKQGCIRGLAADLNHRLMVLHAGNLSMTLEFEVLTKADFEDFGAARARLGEKLNLAKRRPFSAMKEADLLQAIGQPISQGGHPLAYCQVTGEDGENIETREDETKSRFVWSLEELGRKLPDVSHLAFVLAEAQPAQQAMSWHQALSSFGFYPWLIVNNKLDEPVRLPDSEWVRVWRLDPGVESFEGETLAKLPASVVSYRPLAQLSAWNESEQRPKTFDELAESPLDGNFERWGVLRLDVDDLGELFKNGYGDKVSISRYAGLSLALRLFFEGWLPQLAVGKSGDSVSIRERDLSDHLYLQYSGGDDLFIVGSWDALPEFARRIRRSLDEFTGHNPHVTLSAGIDLFSVKFPLYQAARLAGEAEHASKIFEQDGKSKDAITFLGKTIRWDVFEAVQEQAYQMSNLVRAGMLPRGAIQVLLALNAQMDQKNREDHKKWVTNPRNQGKPYPEKPRAYFGSWTWMAAYQFTRMIRGLRGAADDPRRKEAELLLTETRDSFMDPNQFERLTVHGLAARWAQFLTRGE